MSRILTLGFMLLALVVFGCGQSEETKQEAKETVAEKMTKTAETAAGHVKDAAETVAEKAAEAEKQAEPAVKEAVEATKEMTSEAAEKTEVMASGAAEKTEEMASQATEETKQMMAEAKEATGEAADMVADKTTAAAAATTMAAGEAVEAAQQAVSPETIVLEASYGNITFPHKMHSDTYDCTTCHGDATPARFGLDKEKAHALCKECHKKEGAGPTSCKDCHKK